MVTLAVLITCHNRKDTTLLCLGRLFSIRKDIDVYCVDDNSTDGTADAIRKEFPQVNLIHGDGNLFWSRGMRTAWIEAAKNKDYDFYFWLNDDLMLYDDCFDEMLECSRIMEHKAVIAGLVQETTTKSVIYGGYDKSKHLIPANGELNEVFRLNGNFVLVSKYVFEKNGFLDPVYHHDHLHHVWLCQHRHRLVAICPDPLRHRSRGPVRAHGASGGRSDHRCADLSQHTGLHSVQSGGAVQLRCHLRDRLFHFPVSAAGQRHELPERRPVPDLPASGHGAVHFQGRCPFGPDPAL